MGAREPDEAWPPDAALFDPWGAGASSDRDGSPGRPPSPLDLLRDDLVPWLEALRDRLAAGGHRGAIQDLTDLPWSPAVRFLVWPRTGPMEEDADAATVEVVVQSGSDGAEDALAVRHLEAGPAQAPALVAIRPASLATWEWIHGSVSTALREILRDR